MKIYNNSSDAFSNESPLKYQFQFRGCRFLMKIIKSKSNKMRNFDSCALFFNYSHKKNQG